MNETNFNSSEKDPLSRFAGRLRPPDSSVEPRALEIRADGPGPAGAFLKVLSIVAAIIGGIAILLAVLGISEEGLTAEGGINTTILLTGLNLLISSPFIWAAGKALELLSSIQANTRK
jgi:hypothetical protein